MTENALSDYESRWKTDLGKFFPGERVVFRGKDLFSELKDKSWMSLLLYGITGREFTQNQLKLFEGMWTLSISYPDPRIWNNRIAALAGTVKSTGNLGVGAALAITEATLFGQRTNVRAFEFLLRARQGCNEGVELKKIIRDELSKFRVIFGYGRPITNVDERIKPVLEMAKELRLGDGAYTQLAFDIEKILLKGRWRLRMNIGALAAALCADQGLSMREYYYYLIPGYLGGIIPCFTDAVERKEGTFFPFRCSKIQYMGPQRRSW